MSKGLRGSGLAVLLICVSAAHAQNSAPVQAAPVHTVPAQTSPIQTMPARPMPVRVATAQAAPAPITIDVTVLDAAGHPVAEGLSAGNFQVLEDARPVKLLSVAPPGTRPMRTIFVLDEVNDTGAGGQLDYQVFTDMARMRDALRTFLHKQPATLPGDVEVFALTRRNFELVAPPTRDRDALLKTLSKRRPVLPTPSMLASQNFGYGQTLAALRVLALENRGIPGRKSVVWMGVGPGAGIHSKNGDRKPGDPGGSSSGGRGGGRGAGKDPDATGERTASRIHTLTGLMLAARMTLSAVGADTNVPSEFQSPLGLQQYLAKSQTFLFDGDTSFRAISRATGGEFLDGNDVDGEMLLASAFGSEFYTLEYMPLAAANDGSFRRLQVRVTPTPTQPGPLLAFTRAGRYALDLGGGPDTAANAQEDLSAVITAPVPVTGLHLAVARIARFAGSDRAEFTVTLAPGELVYHVAADGKVSECGLTAAIVALDAAGVVLESQLRALNATAPVGDAGAGGARVQTELPLVAVVPKATVTVRIALRDDATGRVGTVDVPRAQVANAPVEEAPKPALRERGK